MGKDFKLALYISGGLFIIIGVVTLLEILLKDQILQFLENLVGPISLFISLTSLAMVPGLLFEKGEGYTKVLGKNQFAKKEVGFIFFLIEIFSLFAIGILFDSILNTFLRKFTLILLPLSITWLLFVYIWFCRLCKYKFPTWITTGLLLVMIFYSIIYWYLIDNGIIAFSLDIFNEGGFLILPR